LAFGPYFGDIPLEEGYRGDHPFLFLERNPYGSERPLKKGTGRGIIGATPSGTCAAKTTYPEGKDG